MQRLENTAICSDTKIDMFDKDKGKSSLKPGDNFQKTVNQGVEIMFVNIQQHHGYGIIFLIMFGHYQILVFSVVI